MSYVEENIKRSENKAEKMGNAILDEVDKFKYSHQINGYTQKEVNYFLDSLVKIVKFNMNTDTENTEGGKEKKFDHEYVKYGNLIIEDIKNSRFTQGLKGYDTAKVDSYLDDIIRLVKHNRDYKLVNNLIDRDRLAYTDFNKSFRGYNSSEVDEFIKKISEDIEKLNDIKRKYI